MRKLWMSLLALLTVTLLSGCGYNTLQSGEAATIDSAAQSLALSGGGLLLGGIGSRVGLDEVTVEQTGEDDAEVVLGKYAEQRLPGQGGGLQGEYGRMDRALEYLYGREYDGRGLARPAGGGAGSLDPSQLRAIDWLNRSRKLFPQEVFERMQIDTIKPVLTEWGSLIPGLRASRLTSRLRARRGIPPPWPRAGWSCGSGRPARR